MKTRGWGFAGPNAPIEEVEYDVRDVGPHDVHFQVKYCGVCNFDLMHYSGEWPRIAGWPVIAGHEVVGVVSKVGSQVTKFKVGDRVGVGPNQGACGSCNLCSDDLTQFCTKSFLTYATRDHQGDLTHGGYGKDMVCRESDIQKIPDGFTEEEFKRVPPLLCAGITMYTPLRENAKPGDHVAILGLGGLGHLGVMLGKAMGCHVTVLSRSDAKKEDALTKLKADDYCVLSDANRMKQLERSFNLIIDVAPCHKDLHPYFDLLKTGGKIVAVAAPHQCYEVSIGKLVTRKLALSGSITAGHKMVAEALDFCAKNHIVPWCEMVSGKDLGQCMKRLKSSDVRYRFVLDHSL